MKKLRTQPQKSINHKITDELSREIVEVRREWRHLAKFKDENNVLFMAFVILVAAAVIVNTIYILNRNSDVKVLTAQTTPAIDSGRYLTSLQPGSNNAETVRISNVTENAKTDYAFALEPEHTMLIMDFSITNKTDGAQHLIPVHQLYVRSDEGDYAEMHASMYVTKPLGATDLQPGKTAKGQISFSVPKHVAHPLLYVDTGWNQNVPLVFDVLH